MSKFSDKLKRLHQSRVRALEASEAEGPKGVFLAEDVAEDLAAQAQVDAAPDELRVLERNWRPEYQHGRYRVGEMAQSGFGQSFDGQLSLLKDFPPESLGFFDIETSGLGVDSVAFCIGLGTWSSGEFRLKQWVMTRPELEAECLEGFAAELERLSGIVSFNGKTFDVPRIQGRATHHGLADPFRNLVHLDLLVVARSLLGRKDGLSLADLERRFLMYFRHGDVPGSQAPLRWKECVEGKGYTAIEALVTHNAFDVLSLAGLLHHFGALDGPEVVRPSKVQDKPLRDTELSRELRKLSERPHRMLIKKGRKDAGAVRGVVAVPEVSHSFGERLADLRHTYGLKKEAGETEGAVACLHELVSLSPTNAFALLELAKHYEGIGDAELAAHFRGRLKF